MDIKSYLKEKKSLVDSFLSSYFDRSIRPSVLHESMKYSLLAGGKRIRPVLCIAAYEACLGNGTEVLPQACALEFIHTYSLIHDDLPAMDNDSLRRGKPTNHVVFGEAMAVLAGDALLTDAFRVFAESKTLAPERILAGMRDLSASAGIMGMVAGQAQDIISENSPPEEEIVRFIHMNKTAALIRSSVTIGARLAGADDDDMALFSAFGNSIGLAFQVIDDILDIEGTTEALGKPRGSDMEKRKMTYPSVYGIERSRAIADELIASATASVRKIKGNPQDLIAIADYLLRRTS